MGIWYFLMLFVGIGLLAAGLLNKQVSRTQKLITMSLVLGSILIIIGLLLFLPGSSTILDLLFQVTG